MSFPDFDHTHDLEHVRVEPFKVDLPPKSFGAALGEMGQCPITQLPTKQSDKPNVLQEALVMVTGPRAEAYGPPEVNWARTSRIAIALTELDCLTPEVCVKVATAMKWARLLQTPNHHDTLVDIPGYGWVLSRVVE